MVNLYNETKEDIPLPGQEPVESGESKLPLGTSETEKPTRFGNTIFTGGYVRSRNFVQNVSGWQWRPDRIDIFTGIFNIGGTQITIDNTQDIQTNLDLIESAGGGTLFLQNGTYLLTADISIPSSVTLQGVSRDGVILDCDGTFGVKITGTNIYTTGTLTINDTETTVVGSGTIFTSDMVGRFIFLSDAWYEITVFTDTTHITVGTPYSGTNLAGYAVAISSIANSATISKLTVTGATGAGVSLQYCQEPILNDLVIYGNGTGIDADYVVFPKYLVACNENGVNLNQNFVEGFYWDFSEFSRSTVGANIIMTNTNNATAWNFSCVGGATNGISATNCDNIAYASYDISNNGAKGIEFISGCDDNQIGLGRVFGNTSDNIKLTATSDRNTIVAVTSKNSGGSGINIANANCDNNVIVGNTFSNNSSGDINDSGTNTIIVGNSPISLNTSIVNISGNQTVAGVKTFSSDPLIPDEAYGAGWDGVLEPPTKNAVYDKIEALVTGALGTWATATQDSATQATTDGFIVGFAQGAASGTPSVTVKTDSANPPTVVRSHYQGAASTVAYGNFICPVKKNHYYLIESANMTAVTAYFIPLGS